MTNALIRFAKFLAVFACCTFVCSFGWERFINGTLYDCTDPGWLDYLIPGDWVHDPVAMKHIASGRPMNEPDAIKAGWSIGGLWCLWSAFVLASIAVSLVAACSSWTSSRSES